MSFVLFVLLVQGLIFGFFCAYIASQKNRDGLSWFLLGFLFSLLALLALIAVPVVEQIKPDLKNTNLSTLEGLKVVSVGDGEAKKRGILEGDILYAYADSPIKNDENMRNLMSKYSGQTNLMKVLRNGEKIELEITAGSLGILTNKAFVEF